MLKVGILDFSHNSTPQSFFAFFPPQIVILRSQDAMLTSDEEGTGNGALLASR
jgi:hypothetical protein